MNPPQWIATPGLAPLEAVAALRAALADPAAIATVPPRQIIDVGAGQLLLMPAELPSSAPGDRFAGVKLVTIAPANPARGLPRINGVYVLFDAVSLVPVALFDGATLTTVRTAAVSALAVDALAGPDAARLLLFGSGPQALAHLDAINAVRRLRSVHIVARTAGSAAPLLARAGELGLAAGWSPIASTGPGADGDAGTASALAAADIVVCATTARTPVFDSAGLAAEATVVAVGSHEPDARELDAALIRRATVIVESRASAATAGDIVLGGRGASSRRGRNDSGGLEQVAGDLVELMAGAVRPEAGRPRVFKSVGESWEDLVVASAAWTARLRPPGGS